jgi:hypothetical protein
VFENGVMDIHDGICRPKTSRADVNDVRVEELLENRVVTTEYLSTALLLSFGSVHNIISEEQGYHKVCARWVPGCLTEEHKNRRFEMAVSRL